MREAPPRVSARDEQGRQSTAFRNGRLLPSGSAAFADLVHEALRIGKRSSDWIDPQQMARAVVGEKISDEVPLLHQLISGPFDADKLDYMPRDATMCGVPIVTDVNRLVQKIRAVRMHEHDLPLEIARTVRKGLPSYTLIGIARSGASTLDEVALGRSLMFDKIYRHHKVRAVEAMIAAICEQAMEHLRGRNRAIIAFSLLDDSSSTSIRQLSSDVQGSGDSQRSRRTEFSLPPISLVDSATGDFLAGRTQLATVMPDDGYRSRDTSQRGALEELIRDADEPSRRNNIVLRSCESPRTSRGEQGRLGHLEPPWREYCALRLARSACEQDHRPEARSQQGVPNRLKQWRSAH